MDLTYKGGCMNKNKCYISGKINGFSILASEFKFSRSEKTVEAMELVPINSLHNGLKYSRPWILHMIMDIYMLSSCGYLFLQKDWNESKRARIEHKWALFFKKTIIYESQL